MDCWIWAYLVPGYLMVISHQEETQSFLRRPYGIKMCADYCSALMGCLSYTFSHQELSCRVNSGPTFRHRDERRYFIKEDRDGIAAVSSGTCPNFSRLLFKRTQSQVCTGRKDPEQTMTNTRMRLLVVTKKYRKMTLQQVYLQNYTMEPYPIIIKGKTASVAYAPNLRRILFGFEIKKIVSYDLDRYNSTTMKRKMLAKSLAVDEERRLVFFSTRSPVQGVGVMTTEGRNFRYIDAVHAYCRYMSVDSKRERLYLWLCHANKIITTTYDGTDITELYKTNGCWGGMTLDYDRNHLYFNAASSVMVVSFPNHITNVTTLPCTWGCSLYYHGGTISAGTRESILTLELGKGQIIPKTELSVKGLHWVVGVC